VGGVQGVAGLAGQALVELVHLGAVAVRVSRGRIWSGCRPFGETCGVRSSTHGLVRDSTLVHVDLELAIKAPAGAPGVLDNPLVVGGVFAPAHDFDCVASSFGARSLLLNS